jgi:hypothetical protein
MPDLEAIKTKWLGICGACDVGIGGCSHPDGDYRPVMLALVRELEKLRTGECVCVWAPDGDGESGQLAEIRPFCPQHGESAEARARFEWWEQMYSRLARAVGVDPAEPFPAVDVPTEVLNRLAELDRLQAIGKTRSGFVAGGLIHINADGLCGRCELPLVDCGGSCREVPSANG